MPAGHAAGHGLARAGRGRRHLPGGALPNTSRWGPAIALLAASVLLLAGNLTALARSRGFAWARFFEVARWALLAYLIIGAMIEYAFLRDHLSGGPLVVLTLSLAVFVVHVPGADRVHRGALRRQFAPRSAAR